MNHFSLIMFDLKVFHRINDKNQVQQIPSCADQGEKGGGCIVILPKIDPPPAPEKQNYLSADPHPRRLFKKTIKLSLEYFMNS